MEGKDTIRDFDKMIGDLIKDEERKLGVNSLAFIQKHNEIIADIERARRG